MKKSTFCSFFPFKKIKLIIFRFGNSNANHIKQPKVEIMEFVSSQKRKQKIIRNGFIYVFQKDLANEVRSYECELRKKSQCKAKIKLDLGDNVIEQLNEHIHPPSEIKVELTKSKSRIKDTAETSEEPPQSIIANKLANISATTMANLPRRKNHNQTAKKR